MRVGLLCGLTVCHSLESPLALFGEKVLHFVKLHEIKQFPCDNFEDLDYETGSYNTFFLIHNFPTELYLVINWGYDA